jgi:formamidopyrimidine-DNA glycosylase
MDEMSGDQHDAHRGSLSFWTPKPKWPRGVGCQSLFLDEVPELPEVETVRRGLAPQMVGQVFAKAIVRCGDFRYPIPLHFPQQIHGQKITALTRRAKYLCFQTPRGHLLVHLGMSGTLRLVPATLKPEKHDHVDLVLKNGRALRFRDPRRFGALVWTEEELQHHPLLCHLGPEPLESGFDGPSFWKKSRRRKVAIKVFLMDAKMVVGVGNIYASEALWRARIHPKRAAGRISKQRMEILVEKVKEVLAEAITQGGTTLRDFRGADGELGYFAQKLAVYGRKGEACLKCKNKIRKTVLGQRSTFWCGQCQT